MKLLALPLLLSLASFGAAQGPPGDRRPAREPGPQERALLDAAAADPRSAAAQQSVAVFYFEASRIAELPELKLSYVLKGIAAADRALAIDSDYVEAITYKSILLRLQAVASTDTAEQKRLLDEAQALGERRKALLRRFHVPFDEAMEILRPVRVGGNIRVPTKVKHVKPVLPAEARASRTLGPVIIETIVGDDGKIANARVVKSIPVLDGPAMDAARQWQFAQTLVNGQAVNVVMRVTVTFTLQ